MAAVAGTVRKSLEARGVIGVGDRALADIQGGPRFTPALCATGVVVGTAATCGVRGGMSEWLKRVLPFESGAER